MRSGLQKEAETARRERLSRRALLGIGLGTALSVGMVALVGPKRTLSGKGEPITAPPAGHAWPQEVSGRVLLPDGTPATGATLLLLTAGKHGTTCNRLGETGADGRYRFPATRQGERFTVVALKPNYGLTGTNRAEATLKLSTPTTLKVHAVDETGEPLRNVPLSVSSLSQGEYGEKDFWVVTELSGFLHAQTNAQGEAIFTGMPESANLSLKPSDARYCPDQGIGYTHNPKSTRPAYFPSVVFRRAVRVSGRVFGPEGKPRAGIVVAAQGVEENNCEARGITDDAGHYQLLQLPPGKYNIALDLPENATVTGRAHEGVTLKATRDQTGLDFTLESGCLITGRVLGADDRPIVGYSVGVYGPAHPKSSAWVQRSVTDAKGRYQLRVPAGEQYLYLQRNDPPVGYAFPKDKERTLTLRSGQTRSEDFILPQAQIIPPITVTVLDASGKPVKGAILRVQGQQPEDTYRFQGLETDLEGHGIIPVRDKKVYSVYAEHEGQFTPHVNTTAGQSHTLRLTETVGALAGRVLKSDGTPLSGHVHLFLSLGDQSTGVRGTLTDIYGHYRFDNLVPGNHYWVRVREIKPGSSGVTTPSHQSETVVVPSGGTVELKALHP